MRTPARVSELNCIATCVGISFPQWDKLMTNTKKANGAQIRKLIKEHLPELYDDLALEFYNPYENRSVKKEGLLVYVHSGIEYFLTYKN